MKNFFKTLFAKNLTFKILSLALALFLWFFVTFRGQIERSFEIPLEFKNTPAEMEILKQSTRKINISVSARERILKELSQNDIRVVIDLSKARFGENSIPITKSSVKLPRGIEILRIEPSQVKLYMDEKSYKTVPVRAKLTGNPAKGFTIISITSEPSQLKIEGAKKELERIHVIKTEPIDVEGISENMSFQAKIDPEGKIFRTDKDTVTVYVNVRRK